MLMPRLKYLLMICGCLLPVMLVMIAVDYAQAAVGQIAGVTVETPNHDGSFVEGNLVDGESTTAWVGGGSGIGPGKWIELTFPEPVQLTSISIANGNQGKGKFDQFRCVTKGVILYPDKTRQQFALKAESGEQRIALTPKTTASLRIIITGVAPGADDTVIGKVAISEIRVFGESAEPVAAAEPTAEQKIDSSKSVDDEKKTVAVGPEKKVVAKPEPKIQAKPAEKPSDAVSVVKLEPVVEEKPGSSVAAEVSAASKPPRQPAAVAVAPQPPAKKKASNKKAPNKKAPKVAAQTAGAAKAQQGKTVSGPSASMVGITRLRSAEPIPADKPLKIGVISPWLDLEFVAQIKRYFALLTTLHDSYPDVFAASIRERELKAFLALQDSMRDKKEFGQHHIAMLEHIGLGFDKPVIRDDSAVVHVSGPYRYYLEDRGYEFMVDTTFSFQKENGQWLINGVQDN